MAVPSVVTFELWYGVAKSTRRAANHARLRTFLSGPFDVIDFTTSDAQAAGELRASLESKGTPIGAYDLLIAGQALTRDMTLVTANVREFSRIKGLSWEDWAGTTRP